MDTIIHLIPPEVDPKDGTIPATKVVFEWPGKEIVASTWDIAPPGSESFPKLIEAENTKERTSVTLSGGRSGVKFQLVNRVVFEDKTKCEDSQWVAVYKTIEHAQRDMAKHLKAKGKE